MGERTFKAVLFTALVLLALSVLDGCAKLTSQKKSGEDQAEEETVPQTPSEIDGTTKDSLNKEFDYVLSKSKPIKEFTPELFVALTVLYQRESKKWLEDSKSLEPKEQDRFIENANRAFFSAYGTTEDAYISYSQSHIEELNTYMSEHPELMKDLIIED